MVPQALAVRYRAAAARFPPRNNSHTRLTFPQFRKGDQEGTPPSRDSGRHPIAGLQRSEIIVSIGRSMEGAVMQRFRGTGVASSVVASGLIAVSVMTTSGLAADLPAVKSPV